MQIHIREKNESLKDIARRYTVSEESIRRINSLGDLSPAEGEELLILTPTRTYTVQYGDTVERIALRFGVSPANIVALNPWICDRELKQGEEVALKYDGRAYGMAAANGYFYKGCGDEEMSRALPYLTYVTFASAAADRKGVKKTFDDEAFVKKASERSKIPLVRVFDRYPERYCHAEGLEEYARWLIDLALSGGYKGVVLDTCALSEQKKIFAEFLIKLRKMMIGNDLILITEIDEKSPTEYSEYADASVLYYPKYAMENPPSFDEGEKKVLSDFACNAESARTFVDLPSLVKSTQGYTCIEDGLMTARRLGCKIKRNENTLLSHFRDKKQGEYCYSSLKSVEELFKLINDYDYMGVCFDIMRTPLSHIMMYNSLFKTSYYTNVRSAEGCSRAGAG